jgi:hypothetical protein
VGRVEAVEVAEELHRHPGRLRPLVLAEHILLSRLPDGVYIFIPKIPILE